ncbi:GNAT family N-acetyltransferase [Knoellia subterranea]|uniref:GCN5 family acetyltransferase n=1 Tax=Knoellia subterranea KCTC 19937 TaxID=1385521 RepID=A0A0A0JJ49_9MICO|nr:GNAT family N-acetyltransferase [Knoellia subterranea]KGN37108.1 GCN5 family acetyltransferase [Knoellia subterranea KCTC 19937]
MGMPNDVTIREATADDGPACAAIYAHYIEHTTATFEEVAPGADEMATRIANARVRHTWLVVERDGEVVGYAYGGPFKTRAAYRYSCEVSVYLDVAARGGGLGRSLYAALLARLEALGFRMACGGVTLPNDASVALHRAMGFEPVGTYRRIGWKHGEWRDVAWFQKALGGAGPPRD